MFKKGGIYFYVHFSDLFGSLPHTFKSIAPPKMYPFHNTVCVPKTGVKIHYSLYLTSEERWWAQIFPACSFYDPLKFLKVLSATPLTRTPKGNEKQFELAGVRVSGVGINFRFSVNN